jgi:hypothetical protein
VELGDLQRHTYKSPFKPLELANRKVTLTPIFSPDHSLDTETKLVERARQTLDIAIPSISGFHYCHDFNSTCKGCPASEIKSKEVIIEQANLLGLSNLCSCSKRSSQRRSSENHF